jgi:cation diffusion facilitator CzcD-associated flavoprotein CzcO
MEIAMENHVPVWTGHILVIGAGCSGIGAAIKLREAGFSDFVLLEKAKSVGGTWRENTYPGCACDVPSALYSFSFAPNAEWTRAFAQQPEIQRYLEKTSKDFGVLPFVRFETAVIKASWHAKVERWYVETNRGLYVARVLVAAAGPLHEPKIPELPGLENFRGKTFHSAQWDHDYDLNGKSVAVIGTGSSAIQFVPKIQPKLGKLHLFQRTAPWVLPKPDHYVPEIERATFRRFPWAQRALRAAEFEALEIFSYGFRHPRAMRHVERIGLWHLRRSVKNRELREKLTPHFTLGCKRILLSNTYYRALTQDNAQVHHTEVTRIEENRVIGADGLARNVDTIIFGTGFNVTDPPIAKRIHRDDGVALGDLWKGSPEAYQGTVVSGFPNLFFLLGPNLGTGHSSAMTIIEAQLDLLVRTMIEMRREKWTSLDVSSEAQATFNAEVQNALQTTVYNAGGCSSYYLDKNGRNSTTWPWSTRVLHERVRAFDARNFLIGRAPVASATTKTATTESAAAS